MRLLTSVETWASRILLTLAVAPFAACNGTVAATPPSRTSCDSPQPWGTSADAGFELCGDSVIHHREALTCAAPVVKPCMGGNGSGGAGAGGTNPGGSQCAVDADCKTGLNGVCQQAFVCECVYGCRADADCGAGMTCACNSNGNACLPATCKSDADCGGFLCALVGILDDQGCAIDQQFACLSAADECATNAECGPDGVCALHNGHLACSTPSNPAACCPSGTCGRPFLIDGGHRQATEVSRSDWMAAGQEPCLEGLDGRAREALAAHWTRLGLMEHASIAAFARFSLQLLAVGAPPELLRDAQAAMAEETEHTRLCFALASAYAGRSIGPGRLSLAGALDAQDDRAILITTIREGCIGETLAALEATEAAAHAADPAVRAVLLQIAADEERHALLAWRYVAWALAGGGDELAAVAAAEIEAALGESIAVGEGDEAEDALLAHGIPGAARGAEIRRQAAAQVIRPAARAMIARA